MVIKKRGIGLTPEELRRALKPEGPNEATVVMTRIGDTPTMLLAQPVARP